MQCTVSLYNGSYQKLLDIDWKHAVTLMMNGKVSACTEDEFLDIRTGSGIFKLPLHIVLLKYIHLPYRELSPSRRNIFKRDNYDCQYCSCRLDGSSATVDHVIPRCRGGRHTWNNVVTCCLKCNRKKGNKTPSESNMPLNKTPKPLRFGC